MHYVISDIHGEFDRYQALLERIDDDILYVLGDAIDRGSGGVDVLKDIMHRRNVVMLMGNHELMCLNAMDRQSAPDARELWVKYNGGGVTRRALLYKTDHSERTAILRWMRTLPDHVDIAVDDRAFHLVHAFPADNLHDKVWTRPHYDTPNPFGGDRAVIIGHTVVARLQPSQSAAGYMAALKETGGHMRILYAPGFIAIDCGCGNRSETRRLACLRLEDMAEYYT